MTSQTSIMTSHCASEVEPSTLMWRNHIVVRRKRLLCDVICFWWRHARRGRAASATSLLPLWRHQFLWRNNDVVVEVWRNLRAGTASRILPVVRILICGFILWEFPKLRRFLVEMQGRVSDVTMGTKVVAMQQGSVGFPDAGFGTCGWDWWYFWWLPLVVACLQVAKAGIWKK